MTGVLLFLLVILFLLSGFVYLTYTELEKVKEIQKADFECHKKWAEHWEEFTMWEIRNSDSITEQQYHKKWKQYAMDGLVLDAKCMNILESFFHDGD